MVGRLSGGGKEEGPGGRLIFLALIPSQFISIVLGLRGTIQWQNFATDFYLAD